MTKRLTLTWWGKEFIAALESFTTDSARLSRGRSYANNDKIKFYHIDENEIIAQVKGSINAYFGVTKAPTYDVSIQIKPIDPNSWSKIISILGGRANLVTSLLMGEMPNNIEAVFAEYNLHLLPHSANDFKTQCSCPDYANPCKHIAGVYYLVAQQLDQDPFLLFELRGISREDLKSELEKTALGKSLSNTITGDAITKTSATSYYTQPETTPVGKISWHNFWQGQKRLPTQTEPIVEPAIPAVLIKKAGDNPGFWQREYSFIQAMTEFYMRVKSNKNKIM
jgi:uncharacterized Zn finger protein